MKKIVISLLTAAMLYACNVNEPGTQSENLNQQEFATVGTTIPDKYIVVLKSKPSDKGMPANVKARVIALLEANGASATAIEHIYSKALTGFSAKLSAAQYKKLVANPNVDYIEADQLVNIVQKKGGKPGGGTTTPQPVQSTPWGITALGGAGNGVGKTAWIIDTGIDLTHPDLSVNSSKGFSAFTSGKDRGFNDGNGHGTHVAGTVAALNNNIGVVGVAAGASVVPVKVLSSSGSGSNSGVIAGIEWVAANGKAGDVANMSLGGGISTALDQAVVNASNLSGVKFTLAAGNESDNANNHSPARANGPLIYTVSAHDINNNFASFSNFGNPPIDVCAPGVSIKSTWLSGGYNTISGTSMATPHVAGLLLLGDLTTQGTVNQDRDSSPDPLAHR